MRRQFLVIVVPIGCLLAVSWLLSRSIHVSFVYCLEARFNEVPPHDEELICWLQGQPGVVPNTVHVRRTESGHLHSIQVTFIQVRSPLGQPSLPDIELACQTFGYVLEDSQFEDVR